MGPHSRDRSTIRALLLLGVAAGVSIAIAADAEMDAGQAGLTQTGDTWVGKRVVQKHADLRLRIERRVVNTKNRLEIYRVEQVNGPWLWLHARELSGWVPANQVVPVEQAIDFFTEYIRTNLAGGFGYAMRAKIWRVEKKDVDKALADCNEAIRLDPTRAYGYYNRGLAWESKHEYDKAIADFTEAVRLDPRNADAFVGRGNQSSSKKEYDKAIADFTESIRLDPNNALAYFNRGNDWCNTGEYDKAIADYSEAIRLDPNDVGAYVGRGAAWWYKKQPDKAIADATEAIRLDASNSLVHYNRGLAWCDKEEYDNALADFDEAIRLDPRDGPTFHSRAWIRAMCPIGKYRDWKKAVESATRACELSEWRDPNDISMLAAAYAEAGDFEKAVELEGTADKLYVEPEAKKASEDRLDLYKQKQKKPSRPDRE
jgi:tetratricopeptide (TPR) repeat protein